MGMHISKEKRRAAYVGRLEWASALLDDIAPKGDRVGVEVGLWKADFAHAMLSNNDQLTWVGVDPYAPYGKMRRDVKDWNAIYDRVMKKMSTFGDRFIMIRKPSIEGVEFVPDNVDFVFIDGNHDYEFVMDDLASYEKKVRSGGIMGGHDYHSAGVRRAVDEYTKEHNRDLMIDTSFDRCTVFWWVMP